MTAHPTQTAFLATQPPITDQAQGQDRHKTPLLAGFKPLREALEAIEKQYTITKVFMALTTLSGHHRKAKRGCCKAEALRRVQAALMAMTSTE
jgi:hypothetical protein